MKKADEEKSSDSEMEPASECSTESETVNQVEHTYCGENHIIEDSSDSDYDSSELREACCLVEDMYFDFEIELDWEIGCDDNVYNISD